MKIASSNKKKLAEYKAMFPSITAVSIPDLPEIKASKDEVIVYKVREINQEQVVVEDTILEVYEDNLWREVVDIKYKLKSLLNKQDARWVVSLGLLDKGQIKVFRGIIKGTLIPSDYVENSFGFDSIFYPENANGLNLSILDSMGQKASFSARRLAMESLIKNEAIINVSKESIKDWTGEFQS